MAAPKTKNPIELEERRHRVSAMYLQGMPMGMIANELGVHISTISDDLKWMRAQWLALGVINFDERKSIEMAKIDLVESEAWKGWNRSLQDAQSRIIKKVEELKPVKEEEEPNELPKELSAKKARGKFVLKLMPAKVEKEFKRIGQSGNPKFLEIILKCCELRLKVIGALKDINANFNYVTLEWNKLVQPPQNEEEPDELEQKIASVKALPAPNGVNGKSKPKG